MESERVSVFARLVSYLNRLSEMICFLIIVFMIVSTIVDTSLRYFFSHPLSGVIEYNGMLVAVLTFLGLANTQAMKGHIEVTSVTLNLSPKAQSVMKIVALTVSMIFVALMIYTTFQEAMHSYRIKEYDWGVIGQTVYIWWAKFAIPIGLSILFLQYILDLLSNFTNIRVSVPLNGVEQDDGVMNG